MFNPAVLDYAPWSYSKASVLDQCALKFYRQHVSSVREARSAPSTESRIGSAAHKVLEVIVQDGTADLDSAVERVIEKQKLVTAEADQLRTYRGNTDKFLKWFSGFTSRYGVRSTLVEAGFGVNREFAPVSYAVDWNAGPAAIREGVYAGVLPVMRGKIDLGLITGDNALVIVDHKSGRLKRYEEYEPQLSVYAVLGAATHAVDGVQMCVHHVDSGEMLWSKWHSRDDIERNLRPWMAQLLNKHKQRLALLTPTAPPPPRVGWYCGWCDFVEGCPSGKEEAVRRQADKERRTRNTR